MTKREYKNAYYRARRRGERFVCDPLHGEIHFKEWKMNLAEKLGKSFHAVTMMLWRGKIKVPDNARRVNKHVIFIKV
jgi:hypothetical protein